MYSNKPVIHKFTAATDHDGFQTSIWKEARKALMGLPQDGGLNIGYECTDAQIISGKSEKVAMRWLSAAGEPTDISYAELHALSNQFANALLRLGVLPGDTVFSFLGRVPELYVSLLGTLKTKAIFSPLFSSFGPDPVRTRLSIGKAKVLVTSQSLYERRIRPLLADLPHLKCVILLEKAGSLASGAREGEPVLQPQGTQILSFAKLMASSSPNYICPPTPEDTPALLHFTSGTTGTPKGALHVHKAILCHKYTGGLVLDLKESDTFWCTADPGWVTGTSYGVIAPLANGVSMIVDEGEFEAERWYETIQKNKVTVLYTAPTAVRLLMKAGDELTRQYNLLSLRHIASVGEPLNPEAVHWSQRVLGIPIRDNWWQTETGGIMIANVPGLEVRPGSMGKPVPGIQASIVALEDGHVQHIVQPNKEGQLALKAPWPSMFIGYLNQEERYQKCFVDGWYLTGDLAKRDADGYFWFVGRADDVIKSAGHLIGPFEVESALMEHPAVSEVGVIGMPDPLLGEVVKAFVSLKRGFVGNESLRKEIMAVARRRLGATVAPREIVFVENLPRTRSGKVMRRLLKARELGLPEGDTSTLESGAAS